MIGVTASDRAGDWGHCLRITHTPRRPRGGGQQADFYSEGLKAK